MDCLGRRLGGPLGRVSGRAAIAGRCFTSAAAGAFALPLAAGAGAIGQRRGPLRLRQLPLCLTRPGEIPVSPVILTPTRRLSHFVANRSCPSCANLLPRQRTYASIPAIPDEYIQESDRTSTPSHHSAPIPGPSPFDPIDTFQRRHVGPSEREIKELLEACGKSSLEELTSACIPQELRTERPLELEPRTSAIGEADLLEQVRKIASKNKLFKSYLGMGYYNTSMPLLIQRKVLENPNWYTQYTPYQPEISQGRLEALLNYQTMVKDLTGLDYANASLLDEATAAAEAMQIALSVAKGKPFEDVIFVDSGCHPQTIAVIKTRAEALRVRVVVDEYDRYDFEANRDTLFGVVLQYPTTDGRLVEFKDFVEDIHRFPRKPLVAVGTDLLFLTLFKPPGEFGADIAFGSSQRFGTPLGYGGPHAAFFAVRDDLKRKLPGRIVGISRDKTGSRALRLAMQSREQHIRRERATSNICTSQALLAIINSFYAVYHGPEQLKGIAYRVHCLTAILAEGIRRLGHTVKNRTFFDTLAVELSFPTEQLLQAAEETGINLRKIDIRTVGVSLDETVTKGDVVELLRVFGTASLRERYVTSFDSRDITIRRIPALRDLRRSVMTRPEQHLTSHDPAFARSSPFLTHPVFNSYHTEMEMLRYIQSLQRKDLSLCHSMIPLGSCTMKLNSALELLPLSWPEFNSIHPFVPEFQVRGYRTLLQELEYALGELTGLDAVTLQPNSGAQGEYTGLRMIKAYHQSRGDNERNVCLIPVSAHGTNPASAVMAGLKVVPVECDTTTGTIHEADLKAKIEKHADRLACIMITYPSTYGVFDEGIDKICNWVHAAGGQVYMDGANMNAQIGLVRPGEIGIDVLHINLHKTFCIPHGGGGPGMGPVCCKSHLAPFMPSHPLVITGGEQAIGPVSASPFGSASILTISWAYIRLMGGKGLTRASQIALLNSNYMLRRLAPHYKILFVNKHGFAAHEFIIDMRPFKASAGIEAADVAKRLQDYGFHAPTMSWPVPNTLMIEPTESESKSEIDRYCDALISIRREIREVEEGSQPRESNILTNAPHPMSLVTQSEWNMTYTRERAVYPMPWLRERKFWPMTSRLDEAYGDRNLVCSTCAIGPSSYA